MDKIKKQLSKYTNTKINKKYYEKNKDKIMEHIKKYKQNLSKEKIKEYNRKSYLKRKAKMM